MSTVQSRAAARLSTGSALVARRAGGWFLPKQRPVAAVIRCGGAVWIGARFGPSLLDHGVLVAIAGACWCRAAWRAKPTPAATAEEEPADETEGGPAEGEPADQDAELQDAPADANLYALIRYVAGMSDQGTAAHLSHVLEEGQARGLFGGWKVPDLRARLEGLGVALVEGKKLTFNGRQRNRLAVLLEALPESAPGTVPAVLQQAA